MKAIDVNKHYIIVGLGMTGMACARFLEKRDLGFHVVDTRHNPPMLEAFKQAFPQIDVQLGVSVIEGDCQDCILLVSPGVSLDIPLVADAKKRGARLSSDVELFVVCNSRPFVAITGSNGKSTVSTLVEAIINSTGKSAIAAGNIGIPVLDLLDDVRYQDKDIYVLELSSFQLERLHFLGADVACILNISEDHMDRYPDFTAYCHAKHQIFLQAGYCVANADDVHTLPGKSVNEPLLFSIEKTLAKGVYLDPDNRSMIMFRGQPLLDVADLYIKGSHNIANVMAAMLVCHCLGIEWKSMFEPVRAFRGLRHRCEFVAEKAGVSFYNDSKATNVGAAVASIRGLSESLTGSLFLVAGGQGKDSDFSDFSTVVSKYVSKVFLIGSDAEKIASCLDGVDYIICSSLEEAVKNAFVHCQQGDIVLLAPACASFDMFSGFEHRGDAFVDAVNALAA